MKHLSFMGDGERVAPLVAIDLTMIVCYTSKELPLPPIVEEIEVAGVVVEGFVDRLIGGAPSLLETVAEAIAQILDEATGHAEVESANYVVLVVIVAILVVGRRGDQRVAYAFASMSPSSVPFVVIEVGVAGCLVKMLAAIGVLDLVVPIDIVGIDDTSLTGGLQILESNEFEERFAVEAEFQTCQTIESGAEDVGIHIVGIDLTVEGGGPTLAFVFESSIVGQEVVPLGVEAVFAFTLAS